MFTKNQHPFHPFECKLSEFHGSKHIGFDVCMPKSTPGKQSGASEFFLKAWFDCLSFENKYLLKQSCAQIGAAPISTASRER